MPVPGTGMTGKPRCQFHEWVEHTNLIPLGSELGSVAETRFTRIHRNSDPKAASVPQEEKAGWFMIQ